MSQATRTVWRQAWTEARLAAALVLINLTMWVIPKDTRQAQLFGRALVDTRVFGLGER